MPAGARSSVRRPIAVVISRRVLSTALRVQRGAGARTEEGVTTSPWAQTVAFGGVTAQRLGGVGCSGTSRTRSNFACRIVTTPALEVDVIASEADRLAETHACGRQQPEQGFMSRRP